jgi:hypothetical protein
MKKHSIFKIASGLFIVPLGIGANFLWPWWIKKTLPVQILTAIFVLPIVGLAAVLTPWWDGF